MPELHSPLLAGVIFLASAAAVWIAGVKLSSSSDALAEGLGIGEALGGLILLGIVTNLPEIAITASAALRGDLGLAVGNILGGISIQTVVLVVLDVFGLGGSAVLSRRAASPEVLLEGLLVVAVLSAVIVGTQLPADMIGFRVTPPTVFIALLWIGGLWLVRQARQEQGEKPAARKRRSGLWRQAGVFVLASLVTLAAGVLLEVSSVGLAKQFGMDGVVFGATLLAAATALPEVSTGLAAVKLRDYRMAVSDIFGGNAFLPVLFLMATLISGDAVLPAAHASDIYLTALGILLTAVYMGGLIFRPRRQVMHMGLDSLAVLLFYVIGVAGLFFLG